MAVPIRFNFKDIADLNEDLKQSPKAVRVIAQRVLTLQLRELRRQQAPLVPRGVTGALRKSFVSSVRRKRGTETILATYGFKLGGLSANAAIAGNVLQKPGATAKKGAYLWIPLPSNRNVTPRDFFNAENTFIRTSASGNKIAFVRSGDSVIPLFVLQRTVRLRSAPVPIESGVEGKLPEITADIQNTIAQVIEARKAAIGAIQSGGL